MTNKPTYKLALALLVAFATEGGPKSAATGAGETRFGSSILALPAP